MPKVTGKNFTVIKQMNFKLLDYLPSVKDGERKGSSKRRLEGPVEAKKSCEEDAPEIE